MTKIEVYKEMALLGAHLQLAAEKIDAIERRQPLYKGPLKNKCNNARKEIDNVLNQLLDGCEESQIEALQLTTKLEVAYSEVLDSIYKV